MKWIQSLDPFLIMTSRASTVYINRLFKSRINTDSTWLTLLTWAGTNSHRRCCIETLCGLVFNNECTVFTNTGCSSWIKGKTLAALRFHILSLLHDQQCFFYSEHKFTATPLFFLRLQMKWFNGMQMWAVLYFSSKNPSVSPSFNHFRGAAFKIDFSANYSGNHQTKCSV